MSINTFPATGERSERRRRRAEGEGSKRENFDDIHKCVGVCVTGREQSFPWPHAAAPTLLACLNGHASRTGRRRSGSRGSPRPGPWEEKSSVRSLLPVLFLAPTSPFRGSAYGFCQRCPSIFHPINNNHYRPTGGCNCSSHGKELSKHN